MGSWLKIIYIANWVTGEISGWAYDAAVAKNVTFNWDYDSLFFETKMGELCPVSQAQNGSKTKYPLAQHHAYLFGLGPLYPYPDATTSF